MKINILYNIAYLIVKIYINDHMKSPTSSIMHSIQALKSKLRSDHLELQGIRRDFAMGSTKPLY